MDQIEKFLAKLDKKWSLKMRKALLDIVALNLRSYQVKKLEGGKNQYRLRMGNVRIIFVVRNDRGLPIDIFFRVSKSYRKH